ncbi:SMI1/KNR4 family protein [Prescottella sp. R16]|uniref:SMI1/KNR4 family protein n=1 Tax=Prescottella sp. R16 TaxID=3064529 RepID=UPI00272DEEF4|nr:SMI1/KNR4 family protein [Prescottella sp. R16]
MHATPAGSVSDQWERISRWLRTNIDGVEFSGAPRTDIDAAITATGVAWPDELVEFFGLANGLPDGDHVQLLPRHQLLPLDRVIDERAMELDIWGEFDEDFGAPDPDSAAGSGAGTYHPAFVPFAGLDGYLLVVDTRPGPLHGCVTEFEKVDTDDVGPRWASLSAMLTDLANSFESGAPFDGGWVPSVVDGRLEWEYAPVG